MILNLFRVVVPLTLFLGVWLLPTLTMAQSRFVTCDGTNCSACSLASLVNEVIVWLFGIVFMIFAVLMVVAGFGLVTSGGNTSALQAAKSKFTNAMIGLLIMMSAWLIVDTIMRGLVGGGDTGQPVGEISGWGPWSEVKCMVQTQTQEWPGDPASPSEVANTTPLPGPKPTACSGGACVPLGIPCSASGCNISPDLVAKLQAFHAAAGVSGARVTEAMPPSREHKSICHKQGTCIDYSKAGGMTSEEVVRVINAATANGLRPKYEVHTQAQKDALVAAGAPASAISVLGNWISAPHFSIYGY